MKGFITTAVLIGTAAGSVGCFGYADLVDPCYPARYDYAARQEVKAAFAPQVLNGHVLDQTVWNYDFEPGTAKLTAGGIEHLAYMARRRPCPDPMIYLQTAEGQDLTYNPKEPQKLVEARNKLNGDRIAAILAFLGAETADRPVAFQVQVHDPAEVGLPATPVNVIVQNYYGSFKGKLAGAAGASVTGGGAAAPSGR